MKRPRKRASSVAVIDIGSNSVRLVVYESMTRSLVSIFNEKTLCGLGREVQTTGLLAPDAVAKALTSLRRFRALCRVMKVGRVYAIATAACRDATNGPDFIARAERICGVRIEILSGPREAKLSALGVISGVHKPDGIVGDLGGGSLELIDVRRQPRPQRRDAAARKPGAAGCRRINRSSAPSASSRPNSPAWPSSRPAAAAPSMRSAAPGGRWRASTSSRADIRCG